MIFDSIEKFFAHFVSFPSILEKILESWRKEFMLHMFTKNKVNAEMKYPDHFKDFGNYFFIRLSQL